MTLYSKAKQTYFCQQRKYIHNSLGNIVFGMETQQKMLHQRLKSKVFIKHYDRYVVANSTKSSKVACEVGRACYFVVCTFSIFYLIRQKLKFTSQRERSMLLPIALVFLDRTVNGYEGVARNNAYKRKKMEPAKLRLRCMS